MESLAALGLAANVMQFVELGTKIVASANQGYRSAQGATEFNEDLEDVVRDLKAMLHRLSIDPKSYKDATLFGLVQKATRLADHLLEMLEHLRVVPTSRSRLLESLLKSIKGQLKKDEIKEVTSRLLLLRDEICQHVTLLLRTQQATIQATIDVSDIGNLEAVIEKTVLDVQTNIASKTLGVDQQLALQEIVKKIQWIHDESQHLKKLRSILRSLHFPQIRERENEIKKAHASTFDWIFNKESGLTFTEWPQSSGGLFWITGKAGCGKSTLMKYLRNHGYLRQLMEAWASKSGKILIVVSHYFWYAGTPLQKSQEGLFRTLLFQIFQQAPEVVSLACPKHYHEEIEDWSLHDLTDAIEALARMTDCPVRVCIFVDGLDEYTGEHEGLVELLMTLSESPNFKICVSSRPWPVFRNLLATKWSLEVHRLTGNDILTYVKDTLVSSKSFRRLTTTARGRSDANNLIQEIVSKAQGVFLWVYLVIRSLQRGLLNGDDIADLLARVRELPGELEPYFERMLNNIDSIYRNRTARTFISMMHANVPLPVVAFYFMDMETDVRLDSWNTLGDGFVALANRLEEKKERMLAQCMDLIHIKDPDEDTSKSWMFFSNKVGFLHRTVSDFLQSGRIYNLLSSMAGADFDSRPSLFLAYFAMFDLFTRFTNDTFKSDVSSRGGILEFARQLLLGTLFYEKEMEAACGRADLPLMRRLDRHCQSYLGWKIFFPQKSDVPDSLESAAVAVDLELLVEALLSNSPGPPHQHSQHAAMITQALTSQISIVQTGEFGVEFQDSVNLPMLRRLLKFGISPNTKASDKEDSVWGDYLRRLILNGHDGVDPSPLTYRDEQQEDHLRACRMLISYGANMWAPLGEMLELPKPGSYWHHCLKAVKYRRLEKEEPGQTIVYYMPEVLVKIFAGHGVAFWEELFEPAGGEDGSSSSEVTENLGFGVADWIRPNFLTKVRRWYYEGPGQK
ncbi:hypothetical protein F5X99DRAFT_254274 [Biscogniauxia marginata]|nr:hypothetical protein F5X99DRAFT_254274 [Biscogniauxia marginata]